MQDIKEKAVKVMAQHQDLERRTNRILGMVTTAFGWDELARELGEVYDVLTEHFELEGQGGYMQNVREALPVRASVVEELEHAHEHLEETLRAIRKECARATDRQRIRDLFQQWLGDLVTHEEAENRLCLEAFGELKADGASLRQSLSR